MSEKKKELKRLNPDIREVQIGTRHLYNLTIYPLSFGQQFQLSDIITQAVTQFYQSGADQPDIAVVSFMVKVIQDNAGKILGFVTDANEVKEILEDSKEKNILNLLSNKQVINIAEILYQDNYEAVSKKVKDLFAKMTEDHQSERSSPDSSDGTHSMDLPIYSESPTGKEGLQ